MLKTADNYSVDYLFAGAGAAATLVLLQLESKGLISGKNIVVIDPDLSLLDKKTFCFWARETDPIVLECSKFIEHKWSFINTSAYQEESISPLTYFHIPGSVLNKELNRIISSNNFIFKQGVVHTLEASFKGVIAKTNQGTFNALTVFDSRPPTYLPASTNEAHLLQSFQGYFIQLENPIANSTCVDLMDFSIQQMGYTQFVYVLPFSPTHLLVELTRFGATPITKNEAVPALEKYIHKRFGSFLLLDTESGCIPMSTAATLDTQLPRVINLGGRAGAIKPSTGYAFSRMFNHARKLVEHLPKNKVGAPSINTSGKFRFYDRLLLIILKEEPEKGKQIFQTLFQKNSIKNVLAFLEEKTTIAQDIRLFATLPLSPFLRACWLDTRVRTNHLLAPITLLLLTLTLISLNILNVNYFNWLQIFIGTIGLFLVGIPHGAVDHLLENGQLNWKVDLGFVFRYLGGAAFYLLFWLLSPNIALFIFLLYSAWHFGQTDIQEWKLTYWHTIKSWIWGSTLLLVLLLGHVAETNQILQNLSTFQIALTNIEGMWITSALSILGIGWGILERRTAIILSACTLAISTQLPLLTAFGVYFIGQHSMNGWSHLKKNLETNSTTLFLYALPFTFGAFFLFITLILALEKGWLQAFSGHWITAFFVFISCISFPHVLTMSKFYAARVKHLEN